MPSFFNIATESADNTDDLDAGTSAPASNDAGLLEGAMEDHDEMVQTAASVDELVDGQDKLTEAVDVASESFKDGGLSNRGLSILKMVVTNIVGKNIANRSLPSMESYGISHPMQVTAIALEGITDTIKQFWQAIKNQMGKFWNQTKSWYLKTFDVANKIIARAKTLDEKANTLSTVPTEKSFEMGGVGLLAVDYQTKDPVALITGLANMKVVLDTTLDNISKENQNDKSQIVIDTCRNLLTRLRSSNVKAELGVDLTPEELKGLDAALSPSINNDAIDKITAQQVGADDMRKKLGIDEKQIAFESKPLPGNRKLYRIQPIEVKTVALTTDLITESLKRSRFILGDTAGKTKEMEESADLKTLNSSQISQIASTVGEMGETILKYKKEFEARDKYVSRIVKGFDQIVKELDGTEVQHPTPAAKPTPAKPAAPAAAPTPAPAAPAATPTPAANPNGGGNGQAANTTQAEGDEGDSANLSKPIDSVDKSIRKLANAMLQEFKKSISLSGSILTHSIKVANVYLTYGERSVALHGS